MGERRHEVTRRRVFSAPRALVWALVADTNRWDRASALTPGRYVWRVVDGVRVRTATARELGFNIAWVEPPYEWVEGRAIAGERRFLEGPVTRGGFEAHLSDVDGGTEVVASAWVVGESFLSVALGPVMHFRFGRSLDVFLDAIARVLSGEEGGDGDSAEPAVTRMRRALMESYDEVTSGERTPSDLQELSLRARRLEPEVGADMASRLVSLLQDRPDEEVAQIRPFELSRVWQQDRREVLRAFLYATRAGLVDLRWQINCPVCRVSAGVAESLEEVQNSVHCEACNIDYDTDFGQHVEAVFQCNPAVRQVHPRVYCASSPGFLPHVYAQLSVLPGETVEHSADLPVGSMLLRSLRDPRSTDLEIVEGAMSLDVVVRADGIEARARPPSDEGPGIGIANHGGEPVVLLFERSGWNADAVLGSVVASFPDFLDLFATEAPASGVELSVGNMTILFSDLTGSTAMYERIGDARAFAIVEHHFQVSDKVVRDSGGAVVKTMGDAIMASFPSPAEAVRAALGMVEANRESFREHGLSMRLGVHAGPCLAVRANDRLDFFGTTVNLAARLESKSTPGYLVLTEEKAAHPAVAELLGDRPREAFDAELKGIKDAPRLVRVRLREDPLPPAPEG